MDPVLLEGFVTLAEELHFGRASARLQIASPTLSKRISELERQFGVRLFDRTSRSVVLTPAGQTLLGPSAQVLADAAALRDLAARAASGTIGVVRGAYTPGNGELIMLLARHVRERHGDVALHADPMLHDRAIAAVTAGTVACAVIRRPGGPGLRSLMLTEHPVELIVVPRDHRLAGCDEVVMSDLEGETMIFAAPWIPSQLKSVAVKLHEVSERSDETELFDLVAAGLGLVCATKGAVHRNPRHEVVAKPLLGLRSVCRNYLVWRAEDSSPVVQAICQIASELRPEFARVAS